MKKAKVSMSTVVVSTTIKNKVAKKVAGTGTTIGEFFDNAAKQCLKPIKREIKTETK